MAAIAYGKGVIAAEYYYGRINAKEFSSFVCEHFASMFKKIANPRGLSFPTGWSFFTEQCESQICLG